jgi:transcriptional regulator with XRE-family HTH domain
MNYNRIKSELERRGITIKELCGKVDVTEQGLHQMIRNSSMKVDVLERISEALEVPVSYWFDGPALTPPAIPDSMTHTIEWMKILIEDLDKRFKLEHPEASGTE